MSQRVDIFLCHNNLPGNFRRGLNHCRVGYLRLLGDGIALFLTGIIASVSGNKPYNRRRPDNEPPDERPFEPIRAGIIALAYLHCAISAGGDDAEVDLKPGHALRAVIGRLAQCPAEPFEFLLPELVTDGLSHILETELRGFGRNPAGETIEKCSSQGVDVGRGIEFLYAGILLQWRETVGDTHHPFGRRLAAAFPEMHTEAEVNQHRSHGIALFLQHDVFGLDVEVVHTV